MTDQTQPLDPEPIRVQLVEEGDKLYADWTQPGARTLLEGVQVLRDNRLARAMPWGRPEMEIPAVDLHFLKLKYPDLASPDGGIKTRAWKRFLASAESFPYRVRPRGRFLGRSVGGI